MKKFLLSIIFASGGLMFQAAHAQVGVNVGVRIGPLVVNLHKPIAPAVVYDEFYYLPDVEAYYSVPEQCYYYMDGNRWVNAAYLPGRYHDYDWRSARRYQVKAQRPYANHDYYKNRFGGNRGGRWGNNDQYASRGFDRRNDRDNDRRFPGSPYDSNNTYGRGGYNQPNGRYDDNRNDRNGWNGQRGNDNSRREERNRPYGPERNQGGYLDSESYKKNRGNDDNKRNDNYNNGQRDYGRPTNQDGGRGNNRGEYDNRGNGNRNRNDEQRYTQSSGRDNRPQMGSVNRMSF
jgi:hypothetical protein